jgi:hypothetical protein
MTHKELAHALGDSHSSASSIIFAGVSLETAAAGFAASGVKLSNSISERYTVGVTRNCAGRDFNAHHH